MAPSPIVALFAAVRRLYERRRPMCLARARPVRLLLRPETRRPRFLPAVRFLAGRARLLLFRARATRFTRPEVLLRLKALDAALVAALVAACALAARMPRVEPIVSAALMSVCSSLGRLASDVTMRASLSGKYSTQAAMYKDRGL